MRGRFTFILSAAALGAMANWATAKTVVRPDASHSKDTFVYTFLPTFNFNAMPGFDAILASGKTASGHDLRSLVQFDLTGVALQPGEIATLNLYVADGGTVGFPVVNPSASFPVTTDVYPVTADWDAAVVNWNNQPTVGTTLAGSTLVNGINRYVSIDVTSQVQSWLSNPSTNFGFSIQQRDVVSNGGSVQSVYHSGNNTQGPFLYVGSVPEPAGAMSAVVGSLMIISRKRR